MKLISLEMEAFESYARKTKVDFSELRGLYLIAGNTGAGKTTIFDAVTYALYGKTSGTDRGEKNLKSDFAAPEAVPYVELVFEHQGKQYRVRREPEYQRPKKRGEGFITESASAELFLPGGKVISKSGEVTKAVIGIVGLDAEQWRQTVMLAQGQFRLILSADTKDRISILSNIFGTGKYRAVAEQLKAISDENGGSAEAILEGIRSSLLGILDEGGNPFLKDMVSDDNGLRDLPGWKASADGLAQSDKNLLEQLKAQEKETNDILSAANTALSEAKALEAAYVEREEHEGKLRDLESRKPEIEHKQAEAARREKAIGLMPREAEVSRAKTDEQEEQNRHQRLSDAVVGDNAAVERAQAALDKAREEAGKENDLRARAERLDSMAGNYAKVDAAEQRIEENGAKQDQERKYYEDLNKQIAGLVEREAECKKIVSDNAGSQEKANLLFKELSRLDTTLTSLHRLDADLAKLEDQQKKEDDAFAEFQEKTLARTKASTALNDADNLFLMGQAGLIAEKLSDGAPCPVCGSVHHPNPAQKQENVPTKEEVDKFRSKLDKADRELSSANRSYSAFKAKREETENTVRAERTELFASAGFKASEDRNELKTQIDKLQSERDAKNEDYQKYQKAADECAKAQNEIDGIRSEIEPLNRNQIASNERQTDLAKKIAEDRAIIDNTEVDKSYVDGASAKKAAESMKQEADGLKEAVEKASEALSEAREKLKEDTGQKTASEQQLKEKGAARAKAEDEFKEALAQCGFASQEEYALLLDSNLLDALKEEIDRYGKDVASARKVIETDTERIAGRPRPEDIPALEEKCASASKAHDDAVARRSAAENRIAANRTHLEKAVKDFADYEEVGRRQDELRELADVALGQQKGVQRISFETYVQEVYMDNILKEASRRLQVMSGGRYSLVRSEAPTDNRSAQALDIDVFDADNGTSRPATSLSGGESFMAALALALGLSDSVSARSGGAEIDTLFIDEGFGSLDPGALRQVIKVLEGIASDGGKSVGVISHVEELAVSIPRQLRVTYDKSRGSRIEMRLD